MTVATAGFAILMLLVFARIPIAFAMIIVGVFGFGFVVNMKAALFMAAQVTMDTGLDYGLSVLPLFILMGNFVRQAGFADELYNASNAFLGHRRGGLAMATIMACGGFSAISGSSLATVATMTKIAMPPMRKYGYADSLATGSIAAGGTLGILIPPSVILIVYGIMTETNIGMLFIAGVVPGLLGILGYIATIWIVTRLNPALGPAGERTGWKQRIQSLSKIWGVVTLFALVMGGIYGGVFTPTEAAAIGASGAFLFALLRGALTWQRLYQVLTETALTTATLLFVLIGALIFSNFVNISGLPRELTAWVSSLNVSPYLVILIILAVYFLLGMVLESMSMVLLTVPTFFPLVVGLGFDPIWFGIIVVIVTEISLVTPPVGLNVFVLRGIVKDTSTGTIFRGVTPFWIMDIGRLLLLVAVPQIAIYLPSLMLK